MSVTGMSAIGEGNMAIGGGQSGSIRMPASLCGIYDMKPGGGRVPCVGIMPIKIFAYHTGPMTATAADNALLLKVIVAGDGYDLRIKARKLQRYAEPLEGGIEGMRIGIVKEGFAQLNAEKAINQKVQIAAASEAIGRALPGQR
jgi:amidase